jgi:hypothetical protein
MSTNLIYNGDFLLPSITTNSSLNSTIFTTQQATDFYWTCGGAYAQLLNGVPTSNFLNPSLVGYTQSCYLLYASSIQQSFTVPFAGSYILSFYYSIRTGYPLNNMQIIINGVLFDTITTTPINWSRYMNTVSNVNLGVNTILFQATSGGNAIVFTGVSFVYGQFDGAQPAPGDGLTATYNNLKTTNINGSLTVLDWIPTGKSLIQGTISTQRNYNYSYTTLPTFYPSSLGYMYSANNTTGSVIANSFTNSSGFAIPIGVYIVDAYARFTPTAASIYSLKLGINTISGALTSLNYAIENILVSSNAVTTINYTYYLSVATTTTYYFVFNTNTAGNLNQTLTGRFLRIA